MEAILGIVLIVGLFVAVLYILLWAFRILAVLAVMFMMFMLSLPTLVMLLVFILFPPTLIVFLIGWFALLVGLAEEDASLSGYSKSSKASAAYKQRKRELGYDVDDDE